MIYQERKLNENNKKRERKKMVKNLITGAGGFVASHMIDLLLKKGEKVCATFRWNEDLSRINHIKDKIELIPMDLNDLPSCIECIKNTKPDYIFHLAAESYVNDSFKRAQITLQTNIIGTYNLLEAIRMIKDKDFDPVVHVCSSSEVYGLVDKEEVPIKENCKFNPSNPYAVSKVGEDMLALLYWTNYGIKTIRTRMFTHTGPGRTMMSAECNFAKQIAQFEKQETQTELKHYILKHGNLNSIRTFADVRDACEAYYLLVRKCEPGEVYNIGGDYICTIGEMLEDIINISPLKNKIIKKEDKNLLRPYDVTLQIPDCSKFKKATGWKPKIKFKQTIKDLLNWWRENV